MEPEPVPKQNKSKCEAFRGWIGSPSFYIYANYILGAWGDWMWQFAVGLYLVKLSDGMLRLAAIYGFCGGGCVLLFGGLVGDWVDRNRRLKVMITTLFLQNMSLMVSASAVCATLFYAEWIDRTLNGGMRVICEAVIIIMAISAQISSVGYKIAIEKDWIVVIAAGNKAFLANLNAVTRAIDLSCKILAPTTVGFIMTYGSDVLAAMVIAAWNLGSVFIEFALLRKVYHLVPALAVKGEDKHEEVADESEAQDKKVRLNPEGDEDDCHEIDKEEESAQPLKGSAKKKPKKEKKTCFHIMFDPFITLVKGWRTYARQKVVYAGLALSFLYMTVLGFDSITTGYIYANGVKEYLVAISMALAGFTGIIGTIVFTYARKKIGLERTGLIAFNAEILCLCLCVASIFLPGSPFQPLYNPSDPLPLCQNGYNDDVDVAISNISASGVVKRDIHSVREKTGNGINPNYFHGNNFAREADLAFVGIPGSSHGDFPSVYRSSFEIAAKNELTFDTTGFNILHNHVHVIRKRQADNATTDIPYDVIPEQTTKPEGRQTDAETSSDHDPCHKERDLISYMSILFFLVGIIASRVGLWMADLVVTQLLQENVIESERGIVNGVQNSLNMLMDMLKFTLVIFVPHIPHFGYLILASFAFICAGGCLFAYHSWKVRGHLFHFDKLCRRGTSHAVNGKNSAELGGGAEEKDEDMV